MLEPSIKGSAQAFMRAGQQHAQFLGVTMIVAGAIFYAGGRYNHWAEEAQTICLEKDREVKVLQARMDKEVEVHKAQIGRARAEAIRARAEAIQETSDKFLKYGYAEEYKRFQGKTSGAKPDQVQPACVVTSATSLS